MNNYLVERTNKETGKSKTELVEAESVSLAILKQGMKYGEGYTYRLVGHLAVSNLDDHNKINKDQLHRFHQYIKSNSESSHPKPPTSSLTLHSRAYLRYMIEGKRKGSDQNTKTRKRL